MTDKLVVFCTAGSPEEAGNIARAVVAKRYAACASILPGVLSIYRWQGAVEESDECLLVIKTRRDSYAALEQEIRALHSYTTPEIIALPVERGSESYLRWIDEETS
jgi:periplasmic divalent cation tolerance protein